MLTPEQIEIRKSGITATDVVALAGLSPYRASVHAVWAAKMGLEVHGASSEATELGHELEPVILRRLAAKRGLVIQPGETVRSRIFPHHLATPDGLHVPSKPDAVCEAKAVGLHYADSWGPEGEDIPDHVLAQVTWQMHCTGLEHGYVGALIGTEVRTYEVTIDHDLVGALVEVADKFWTDFVLTKRPPAPDGSEQASAAIARMFPRSSGQYIPLTPALDAAARHVLELRARVGEMQRTERQLIQEIQATLGEAEGFVGPDYRVTWKPRKAYEVPAQPARMVPAGRVMRVTETKAKGEAA